MLEACLWHDGPSGGPLSASLSSKKSLPGSFRFGEAWCVVRGCGGVAGIRRGERMSGRRTSALRCGAWCGVAGVVVGRLPTLRVWMGQSPSFAVRSPPRQTRHRVPLSRIPSGYAAARWLSRTGKPVRCRARIVSAKRARARVTISFTALGLALPPVAFITWPTNQPASLGFCLAFSTCAGLAAMILVDRGLDGAGVGDLLHAARLDDLGGVAALGIDDLEQVLGDLAGDVVGLDQRDDPPSCAGETGLSVMECSSFFSRPKSSLITQLAASFPSPAATTPPRSNAPPRHRPSARWRRIPTARNRPRSAPSWRPAVPAGSGDLVDPGLLDLQRQEVGAGK
jgi:hypothetical protein